MKEKFPRLSCIALGVLSIPASSASSERAFSCSGNTITKNALDSNRRLLMLCWYSTLNSDLRKINA